MSARAELCSTMGLMLHTDSDGICNNYCNASLASFNPTGSIYTEINGFNFHYSKKICITQLSLWQGRGGHQGDLEQLPWVSLECVLSITQRLNIKCLITQARRLKSEDMKNIAQHLAYRFIGVSLGVGVVMWVYFGDGEGRGWSVIPW